MSSSPFSHIGSAAFDATIPGKRERPPALTLDPQPASDGEVRYQQLNGNNDNNTRQVRSRIVFPAMGIR